MIELGYEFKNKDLLKRATTHSSKSPENYERLEFLGDSILDFVVGEYLFVNSDKSEGELTVLRSHFVSEANLCKVFDELDIEKEIILGKSWKGALSKAVKCDIVEAIIGAIYIDSGLDDAKKFIVSKLRLDEFDSIEDDNYKSKLQELIQANFKCKMSYVTEKEGEGFSSSFYMDEDKISSGFGMDKTSAEQDCAKKAIKVLFKIWKSGDKGKINMILKKIEMAGFKSFADKTVLDFSENFSAIVGPNGCGKSNVADAIRWVLGEQKVKDLRADSMQDVIFNGTEKRKSLSYCEVSLYFDNSTRFFPNFDYDELIITRKLYRSGESEYLINKNTCRLLDINNILYNSGLGKNGYSIIGQGKITELVEAKPENRRFMFEDAAGISKYKKDKTDAENKLSRTRLNLERVNDILQEIERQMGPLKKQAETAKKYLELKAQLKDLEVNAYVYQYENANDAKEKIRLKLRAIEEELGLRQAEFDKVNSDYSISMEQSLTFDQKLSKLNDKILELTVSLEKQEGETKIARERIIFTQKENDRINLDLTNANKMLDYALEQNEKKHNDLNELKSKLLSLEASFDELSKIYSSIAEELYLSEDEAGQSQQKIIETLGSLSDVKSNLSRLQAEKEILSSRLENISRAIDEQGTKKEDILTNYQNAVKNIENISNIIKLTEASFQDFSLKISFAEKSLRENQEEKANIITQIKVCENRKKLLSEMQADYEGYAYSVKKLLKEGERNNYIRSKMVGVVASLINVPTKFETAVEVALGNSLQNIVTFDENGANELINYLKDNHFGRATFLPISSMKRRDFDKKLISGYKGCFGVASDLIEFDSKIDNVISNLLGSTVIVDSLETAIALAKEQKFAFRIVTLEGDLVNPQGSMTGGSKKTESVNLINRQREIDDLSKEIEKLERRKNEIEQDEKTAVQKVSEYRLELQKIAETKSKNSIEFTAEKSKEENLKNSLNEVEDDLKISLMEKESVENKIALIAQELQKSSTLQSALSGNKEDADLLIKQRKEKYEKLRLKRDEVSSNITTVKVEIASVKANIESVANEIARLENEIGKQKSNINIYQEHLQSNNEFIESAEQMIKSKLEQAPTSKSKQELFELKEQRENIESEKQNLSRKIKELDSLKSTIMENLSRINDKKYREEMNLSKVDSDIEVMQERIFEEYSMTYANCLEHKRPDFDISFAMPEISRIKRAISNLGAVNVNAIEDCSALLDRFNEMNGQAEDLKKAEEDLTKIIKDLSGIMIEKFLAELNKINESFKITFRELFGGGNAKLELTDPSSPLESGVEVFVQPPGKKIQNMSLYSGGEKSLTAMAIIFAILRIKPLPFCLFDEVEAALDDSNVEIVDKYLKKLSNETQFILITHKKPTMENADALFGVTMEEKGVSKIVSVKLADAIKQAQ